MTSILVSPTVDTDKSSPTVSRAASRSLDIHSITGGDLSLVLPYRKPTVRPEPVLQPPPTADDLELNQNDIEYNGACTTEMLYNILRSGDFGDFAIPPWAQYHNCISTDRTPQSVSTVAFNPIIMAPPNDYATIYTTLMRFKDVSSTLGHSQIPVCFDMGLLTKALEIVWAHPKELPGVIPFEGGMHFLLSVFSGIGFLYGDAGLRQLLQDSGVFAVGTTQQILSGRDFDRTMYALKLVDKVLNSRFLHQFSKWCEKKGIMPSNELCDMLQGIADYLSLTESSVISTDMLNQTQEFVKLHLNQLLEEFRTEGRTSSPTFRLWDDFLTKVMLPFKTFITSTKNAQWSVYQASKSKLLPLLFASNRTNYARYLPVLLLMMQRLPSEVKDAFENGLFVAKLTDGRFNGVWMDYTLEATENKALKGNGGIIGLTLRGTALTRWFLARPVTAIYSTNFSGMLTNKHRVAQQQNPWKLMSKSEVKRWNADVIKMKQMFDGTFSDPFSLNDPPLHLINFATGCVALPAVEESLIGALDKGLSMASTFIRDRLVPEQDGERPKKGFYAPLTRSNVKTMAVMNKTVKLSTQNISINGEVMFLRLLAVNATKQVPLQRLLSFENSPVPLSLFSEDGSPLSCVKSLFMHKLEGLLAEDKLTFVAGSDAIIFDGHAIIQMLPGPSGTEKVTFKDMASHFIRYILHVSEQHGTIKQIHVAFDRYDLESIKNIARQKRTAGRQGQEYHVQPDIQAPSNWNVFLSRGENKSNLAKCYTNYMKDHGGDLLKGALHQWRPGGHGLQD